MLDNIIDRNLSTSLDKFTGIKGDEVKRGSLGFGEGSPLLDSAKVGILSASFVAALLGWLILRGKCRFCKAKISPEYPIVEAFTAGVFVLFFVLWFLIPDRAEWLRPISSGRCGI